MNGIYWMNKYIPIYGIMIAIGIISSCFLGYILIKKYSLVIDNLILLSAYGLGGGMIGAKLLYIIITRNQLEWDRIFEWKYINMLLQGGYVFYGGLLGGCFTLFLAGRIHKIRVLEYLKVCIPCIPLAHGFGRIGCHFAGCCYGIPYTGIFHVVYHAPSFAPKEIPLFPVQLLEAFLNFLIAIFLFIWMRKKGATIINIYLYLLMYSVQRFILEEYFRYDIVERGKFLAFSTSQWISILILFVLFLILVINYFSHNKKVRYIRLIIKKYFKF